MDQRPLGKYELQERLRYSSTDETWKAFDTQQHRYVNMRIIKLDPEIARMRMWLPLTPLIVSTMPSFRKQNRRRTTLAWSITSMLCLQMTQRWLN